MDNKRFKSLRQSQFNLPLFRRKVKEKGDEIERIYNWSTSIPEK